MIVKDSEASAYQCCADLGAICAGSRCMAWRWAQVKNPDWSAKHTGYSISMPRAHPADEEPVWVDSVFEGYCGLAGRVS